MSLRDWRPQMVWFGGMIVVGVGASLIQQSCHGPAKISPAVHDSLTALKVTRGSDSAAHAAVAAKAETILVKSVLSDPRVQGLQRSADSLKVIADSAVRRAERATTAQDSATQYHLAYGAEHKRADSLQAKSDTLTAQRDSARFSARLFAKADTASQARNVRLERALVDLQKDVERATTCRVLPFVPCPSRKLAVIGTAVLTVVAIHQLK